MSAFIVESALKAAASQFKEALPPVHLHLKSMRSAEVRPILVRRSGAGQPRKFAARQKCLELHTKADIRPTWQICQMQSSAAGLPLQPVHSIDSLLAS
jgi:hypothetical protein